MCRSKGTKSLPDLLDFDNSLLQCRINRSYNGEEGRQANQGACHHHGRFQFRRSREQKRNEAALLCSSKCHAYLGKVLRRRVIVMRQKVTSCISANFFFDKTKEILNLSAKRKPLFSLAPKATTNLVLLLSACMREPHCPRMASKRYPSSPPNPKSRGSLISIAPRRE